MLVFKFAALLIAAITPSSAMATTPVTDGQTAIEIGSALARNDWQALTKLVPSQDISQDEKKPVLAPGAVANPAAYMQYLSGCGFIGMMTDYADGPDVDFERDTVSNPSSIQLMWLCPGLASVAAHVSKSEGGFGITFEKAHALQGDVEEYKRSRDNRRLIEALKNGSITDGKFELGKGLKGEPARRGEPSDAELSQIALRYLADIAENQSPAANVGLDYIDLTKLSWANKESTEFKPFSFEEARQKLRSCRAQSGWPRRFDRDGHRIFAFDSRWVCFDPTGPYTVHVFLEIAKDGVAGGRIVRDGSDN